MNMKATMTIEPDVADALKERARAQNKSFEQVVNEALRRDVLNGAVGEKPRPKFRVKPNHSGFAPGVDPMKLKELMYKEDDERFLRLTYGEDTSRWPAWLRERRQLCNENNED